MRESLLQFQFSSLAENWCVDAKLIYKYQILYLDYITIVLWRHLVNDIDLCHSPKLPKTIKPPILAFTFIQGHWIRRQSRASVHFLLVINSNLGPISHCYWDKCTKHQFLHLLTATFKDLHIENSKNYKRWYYSAAHWHTVSVMWAISPFVIFAVFNVQVFKCCR